MNSDLPANPDALARRGGRRVSVREVARLAGVSVGTVSNVLNRRSHVAQTTRERVEQAIEQLGFVPNDSARQLRTGRSRTVGLLVLDLANPFFTELAAGVEDTLWEAHTSVILCNSHESRQREAAYLETLAQQRVGGLVLSLMATELDQLLSLRHSGIPIVLADRPDPSGLFPAVTFDEREGGAMAIRHLLDRGHTAVSFIGYNSEFAQVPERLEGAKMAWAEAGLAPAELGIIDAPTMTVAGGVSAAEEFFAQPHRPRAVFCANDLLALGFLQVMTRQGLRAPDDVAIVGYDDIGHTANGAAVPLTSVHKPARAMGATAATMLCAERERLAGDVSKPAAQTMFSPELVIRASS